MRELGKESVQLHQSIINLVQELNVNAFVVGENFFQCNLASSLRGFETMSELIRELQIDPIRNKTILLKGSRGMRMESIVQYL